jgi:hypothetical protein
MSAEADPGPRAGADDFRLLLTVIAGIALGVAATAMPSLIVGPFDNWSYGTRLVMWLTGVAAVLLEYLAVLSGSRLYLRRVDVVATASLAFVFLSQAGMFAVVGMDADLLGSRWFTMFAIFNLFAGLEAEHARRVIVRHGTSRFDAAVVDRYALSLRRAIALVMATALAALVFVVAWNDAPPPAVFVASCVALGLVIVANAQQYATRAWLSRCGA